MLILFFSSEFGGSISVSSVTEFIDAGHNVMVAGSSDLGKCNVR